MDTNSRVGPYVGVSRDFNRGRYRILIYGAFDAYGLIGTECNGIAVLDNEDRLVVADELGRSPEGGWFGPTEEQRHLAEWLRLCPPDKFAEYINSSGRNRHVVDPATVPTEPPDPFVLVSD